MGGPVRKESRQKSCRNESRNLDVVPFEKAIDALVIQGLRTRRTGHSVRRKSVEKRDGSLGGGGRHDVAKARKHRGSHIVREREVTM